MTESNTVQFERKGTEYEKPAYKGHLIEDEIENSPFSGKVIAHYEIDKDGYDAPATVYATSEDALPNEAWFVYDMGGFKRIESVDGELLD